MSFAIEKQNSLSKKDKSQKGSIDKAIIPLLDLINSYDDYFTTSSCSGRIVLIEKRGKRKDQARWLLASHDKVTLDQVIASLKTQGRNDIWLKQESWILHVACRRIDSAKDLLKLCHAQGLKRSGITSLGRKIMVEIMSTESLSTLIAKDGVLLITNGYLKELVDESNYLIDRTRERLASFQEGFSRMIALNHGNPPS